MTEQEERLEGEVPGGSSEDAGFVAEGGSGEDAVPPDQPSPGAEEILPPAEEALQPEAGFLPPAGVILRPDGDSAPPTAEAGEPEFKAERPKARPARAASRTAKAAGKSAAAEDAAGVLEAPAGVAAEGGTAPRRRWYVVHTYSGHENKVKANLERAIQYNRMQDRFGEILVVTEDYAVMKAGKKRITKRKTFPSYVLMEMEMSDETRALVQNIPGVTHFVGDRNAAPLTESEVRRIRGQEVKEKGAVTTEVPFKVGESVKVMDGPFADFVGTVDEINPERGKLRVMVSIFGRPTAVELDIAQVTTI